ncbi:TetR/AcrR family transcriptional regulator [Kineothrix sp. MSJ-39]|uniref:TetR/AcrR family transcriptional regulator n=1 Tax=Kineothrix sp. MSJ-39 TaxID=2841533 RepID=UPI001C1190FD|nr:TetR/AcrR family transcriptional regulator [Kineothrix sp. MSJ-39]MBU5430922.1 TetR/AcrR family transcriptional regulator [Kineothrix sp. MSJ-39]
MRNETHIDRRSRYSIQVIRQALFELLETKALDEITVVDICAKADVNRGTFYKYYRDVPDLYDKTEDSLVEEIYALIKKTDSNDFQDHFFFREILHILANNKEFTYIAQNKAFSERLAQKLLAFFIPYLKQMLHVKCPHASEQDSDLLLEYVLGGCIRVVSYWLKGGMQISIDEINNKLSAMITYSFSMYE